MNAPLPKGRRASYVCQHQCNLLAAPNQLLLLFIQSAWFLPACAMVPGLEEVTGESIASNKADAIELHNSVHCKGSSCRMLLTCA